MKKDGFIFMESLTVLIVVLLATTMLLSSYSLFVRKSKEKENYNIPSDRYLLFNIAKLNAETDEYFSNNGYIANRREGSYNNPDGCERTPVANRLSDCQQLFKDNDLVYFIVIKDIKSELKRNDLTKVYDSGTLEFIKTLQRSNYGYNRLLQSGQDMIAQDCQNGICNGNTSEQNTKSQISTQAIIADSNITAIKITSQGYIIGVFYKNGTYRYAAIPLYGLMQANQTTGGVLDLLGD